MLVQTLIEYLPNTEGLRYSWYMTIFAITINPSFESLSVEEEEELQKVVNRHPSIAFVKIDTKCFVSPRPNLYVKETFRRQLRNRYHQNRSLNEAQLFFMGDGRVGKSSTLRMLCGRRFLVDSASTVVLEDTDILQLDRYSDGFNPISKYNLSVQRVKNVLADRYEVASEKKVKKKYNLTVESELIERVVREKDFIEYFAGSEHSFQSSDIFFRVCDFGGQEIFSSIHHVFMNRRGFYIVVFKLTALNEKDMHRISYWCESILRHAKKAPVMFVGTFLNRFIRKFGLHELYIVNLKIENLLLSLSQKLNVMEGESNIFFPVDNTSGNTSTEAQKIKEKILHTAQNARYSSYSLSTELSLPTIWVLFLDSCREESNYMSLEEFKRKAKMCNLSSAESSKMLKMYKKVGIISYFPKLKLPEKQNFIFFAPSYIAQALGSFIRDPNLHQLAYRVNSAVFSDYRKYIDTGIITRELFNVLMKEYSKLEISYVIQLALKSMILIRVPTKRESYVVPELLPDIKKTKLKFSRVTNLELKFDERLTRAKFVKFLTILMKADSILESLLFENVARFIFDEATVVDIYLKGPKILGVSLIGSRNQAFLRHILEPVQQELRHSFSIEES
eukprot:snap_masked-scaffold_27-processed-gene-1.46-mRNA-1 protein AED:1.00 eAED:1.00 QI:0/0/0/0/1/1/3/0/618